MCKGNNCKKQGIYNYKGETKPLYCSSCKLDNMIDVIHHKCIICNNKRPSFGMLEDKKAYYSSGCKLKGKIDIINPKCIICNNKRPYFAMSGEKIARYCTNCKLDNMINIISSKCIICNYKIPCFAMAGEKIARYCSGCKLKGMIDIINPKCIICNYKQAYFAMSGEKIARYCYGCKLKDMIDIKHPKCKSSWCNTYVNKRYDGYCRYCFMHLFPDIPISRNYKTKEKTVIDYIKEHLSYIDIITDKKIDGGCSKRRPDILIDVGFQIIIVEIDENQHSDYDCSCENKRLMELSQDVGFRPIIFIRFNPDSYKINDKKITSCWYINKLGICQINKKKTNEWNDRLKNLKETIEYWIQQQHKIDKTIEIIQLYYNQ